jgi:hypothetical protein
MLAGDLAIEKQVKSFRLRTTIEKQVMFFFLKGKRKEKDGESGQQRKAEEMK